MSGVKLRVNKLNRDTYREAPRKDGKTKCQWSWESSPHLIQLPHIYLLACNLLRDCTNGAIIRENLLTGL